MFSKAGFLACSEGSGFFYSPKKEKGPTGSTHALEGADETLPGGTIMASYLAQVKNDVKEVFDAAFEELWSEILEPALKQLTP